MELQQPARPPAVFDAPGAGALGIEPRSQTKEDGKWYTLIDEIKWHRTASMGDGPQVPVAETLPAPRARRHDDTSNPAPEALPA